MVKKFTLMFLLGIFGLFSTNLFAQEDATIDPADIKFWIGEGENEVVFIANWAEPDTALAWGYRFVGENVTIKTIMDDISAVDPRFSYEATESGWLVDMHFNNGTLDLSLTEQMWVSFLINGNSTWDTFDVALVANGEYVKMGDTYCGTLVDPVNYIYVWEKEVAAVYPYAVEAMIDPSEITYWIGEGENSAILCVNWNEPNIALAWGYKFNGEATVEDMMNAIAESDGRFSYTAAPGYVMDIQYNDYVNQYALVGPYWMYNVNGYMAWFGFDEQAIVDGDFVKFGDVSCATEIAEWTYVWTQPVEPVTVWNSVNEVEAATLSVYPNPATDRLFVNAENLNYVEIFDMTGRSVMTSTMNVIDLSNVEAGIYFVTVRSENAAKTIKLVVK